MEDNRSVTKQQEEYLKKLKQKKYSILGCQISLLILFLSIWEISVRNHFVDGFIFSSPSRMIKTFFQMSQDHSLWNHIWNTLSETGISFFLVSFLGIMAAVILWYHPMIARILDPYLVIMNSLPKSALAPLLIVWFGPNKKAIIVAGISVALFGTIMNLYTGFCETDPDDIKLIYTLQGKKKDVLTKVIIPGSLPLMLSVMKVNIGLCLVGVVIGEFIGAKEGLGYMIIYGSQIFRLDWVILAIVILCIIAVVLYRIIAILERHWGG